MRKIVFASFCVFAGFALAVLILGLPPTVRAGGGAPACSSKNGDVNGNGDVDLSDAVTILNFLFLGNPAELVPLCTPPGACGLPDSGQTNCYDENGEAVPCEGAECPGQDGSYASGCPLQGRFTDNGDGTVTDHCTGLQWQKNSADVNFDGQSTSRDVLHWCNALVYCENLGFAGHDDWRLPNLRELQSIVDYGRFLPSIDPAFGALSALYWSSTSVVTTDLEAWVVDFQAGGISIGAGLGDGVHVRAVRNAR